jgi:cold shock CspA family protein
MEPEHQDRVHGFEPPGQGLTRRQRMHAGVIMEMDPQGCFGIIESDEGEIVLFSRDSLRPNCEPKALSVGQRVEFTIDKIDPAPYASGLKPRLQH